MGVEHTQGLGTTHLYPANIGAVDHGLEVREGMVWRKEKGEAYSKVSTQVLLGEISCWDNIPPKRGNDKLESLDACYRS